MGNKAPDRNYRSSHWLRAILPFVVALLGVAILFFSVAGLFSYLDLLKHGEATQEFGATLKANIGPLLISAVAVVLAALAMYYFLRLEQGRLEFEKERFKAERDFRQSEYEKFRSDPALDLAKHVAELLRQNPDWARRALEEANLASYTYSIFGDRSHHLKQEKLELAKRFWPYLLSRCRHLIDNGRRHVYLLIDAGTTLYPFFQLIGQDTARSSQRNEDWIKFFHLATNNLPGLEQLMKWGRRVPYDRYSPLAIEDCHLLPGIPMPVFAAVAGDDTERAITDLRKRASAEPGKEEPIFLALVVGNWVRIRRSDPRCPVPMARGAEHCHVKNTLVANADEIYVVSPLAKNFVGQSKEAANRALGFFSDAQDSERKPYDEVLIEDEKAKSVKLVTTFREEGALLYRHSVSLEAAMTPHGISGPNHLVNERQFAAMGIEEMPHLQFEFRELPDRRAQQLQIEFPHYDTRRSREFLDMFQVDLRGSEERA